MTNKYDDARQNAQNWYDSDMGHITEYKELYYWGKRNG